MGKNQSNKSTAPQAAESNTPVVDEVMSVDQSPQDNTEQTALGSNGVVVQDETTPVKEPVFKQVAPAAPVPEVLSAMTDIVVYNLNQYVAKMRPGIDMTPAEGAVQQKALWRNLKTMLERSTDDEFPGVYSATLAIFKEHADTVFSDRYVMRFMSDVQLDKDEIFAFQAIVNLINKTADPKDRAAMLRQVDMSRTLSRSFSEAARQRVLAYYNM